MSSLGGCGLLAKIVGWHPLKKQPSKRWLSCLQTWVNQTPTSWLFRFSLSLSPLRAPHTTLPYVPKHPKYSTPPKRPQTSIVETWCARGFPRWACPRKHEARHGARGRPGRAGQAPGGLRQRRQRLRRGQGHPRHVQPEPSGSRGPEESGKPLGQVRADVSIFYVLLFEEREGEREPSETKQRRERSFESGLVSVKSGCSASLQPAPSQPFSFPAHMFSARRTKARAPRASCRI